MLTIPFQKRVPAIPDRPGHRMSRQAVAVLLALGLALLMLGIVLAANNTTSFPPAAEQIALGEGYVGTYTDTRAADGVYRVLQEAYVTGTAKTLTDNPAGFSYTQTYTGVIAFIPYTMPAEGGFIYRIAPYIAQTGTTRLRVALYADTDGLPRLLLAQSEVLTVSDVLTGPGWLWFDIEPQRIPGNTRYWIAYQADNDQAKLIERIASEDQLLQRSWSWGPFPALAGQVWGGAFRRPCFGIAYTATQYALDASYTVPVTPSLDVYTLTVRGATSGEPFSVTADGHPVGLIAYTPTAHTAFSDDMESGAGGWTADGFYRVISGTGYYSSHEYAWWTDDVPYTSTATLTSAPITIPFSARNMELQFWMRMVSEFGWDGGWLEYRVGDENGNWSPWSEVAPTDFVKGGYNCILGAPSGCQGLTHLVSGPHNGWSGEGDPVSGTIRVQIPISATGRLIQWRWVFECDPIGGQATSQPDGWWIDDVRVVGTVAEDTVLVWPLPVSAADDGQVAVRFQDTLTNTYPDLLGIDLVEITGILYNRAPVVTVTFPNGGEYLSGTQTVTWTGLDFNGDVVTYNIYLSLDNGANWSDSFYQVTYPEGGTPAIHSWNGFNTAAFTDCDQCLLRIAASDGETSTEDFSDAVFFIDNTPPTVTLTAPNGDEVLRGGSVFTITWTATDAHFGAMPIGLAYSLDGGATYTEIVTATANDGQYAWTVPEVETTTVRVRVTATDRVGHSASDASDGDFAIDATVPGVTLTAPNGDEVLRGGSVFTITWTATDAHFGAMPIGLAYSLDGGNSYTTIVTATENDGQYAWAVPEVETTTVRVRVTATDRVGHFTSDESEDFAIDSTPPTGTISIAEGAYTGIREIHLFLTASDDVVQMYLDGDLEDAANVRRWTSYTSPVTVTLVDAEGGKIVRVRYQDLAGNLSGWAEAQLVYDATPPVIADLSPANGSTVATATPVISATVQDQTSGIDPQAITMTVDGVLANPVYNGNTVSWIPDSPLTNISHTVTLLVLDRAGNSTSTTWAFAVSEPPASILLTASPPAIVADGVSTATITAAVTDRYNNPVADGTEVVFTTTMGTLSGDTVYTATTQAGFALAVLTAPTTDGVARITARAGSAEGSVDVLLIRYRVYLPLILRLGGP
ncbi:MAG: hypothetical protein H5T61_03740 [Thermoflexales bacterium]|nr:hypothetical protein [Thermoflexales bacterium]